MPSRRLRTVARASRTRKEAVLRLEIKTLMCLTSPWIHADRAFVWRRQQPRPYRAVSNEELPAKSSGTRLKTYLLPSPADACNAVSFRPWSIWRAAINCYLGEHCRKARPLVWTAYPDRNIGKVNRGLKRWRRISLSLERRGSIFPPSVRFAHSSASFLRNRANLAPPRSTGTADRQ